MGFTISEAKSASNVENDQLIGATLDSHHSYKYLGIWEFGDGRQNDERNKQTIRERIKARVEVLCDSKLTGKNLFAAINQYVISVINYFVGVIDYQPSEFEELDKEVRRILMD